MKIRRIPYVCIVCENRSRTGDRDAYCIGYGCLISQLKGFSHCERKNTDVRNRKMLSYNQRLEEGFYMLSNDYEPKGE